MDYGALAYPSGMARPFLQPFPPGQQPPLFINSPQRPSPPQRRHYSPPHHKRSLQTLPPAAENLQEAVQKVLEAKDVQDVVIQTAQLVQDVVGRMDEDGCLFKLLCLLQEKPRDTRAPEEALLVSLYHFNAPEGSPRCGQEILKCPVEEAQLVEAFSYTWHLQDTV